jgi:predicted TIM-barrel fold metal-dependent hydrolase
MVRYSRRRFLHQLGASGAALAASGHLRGIHATAQETAKVTSQPIVDTHQHLWDLVTFRPPWLESAPDILRQRHATEEYRQATEGLPVRQAVYMEIDVDPRQQLEEAEAIIRLCESGRAPTVAAVISGRPGEAGFREYINRFRDSSYIKGVRQVLHADTAPAGLCLQPTFVESVRHMGTLGMSFDLCMRPGELADGAELARRCPDTRFIVDHCGNADPKAFLKTPLADDDPPTHAPEPWRRDMARLADLKNVVCKISGIVARAPKDNWTADHLAPIVTACLELFGPDRVMFGSDWPVCRLRASYRQWVTALWEIIAERPVSEQSRLLHDNAVAFYGLKGP